MRTCKSCDNLKYGKCNKGFEISKSLKTNEFLRPSKCKVKSKEKIKEKKTNSDSGLNKKLDKLWSEAVHLRDKVCRVCGNTKGQAHHIFTRKHFNTRWNLENGILLCFDCHKNTAHEKPLDFFDWLQKQAGQDWIDDLRTKAKKTVKFSKEEKKEMIDGLKKFIELEKIKRG